MGCQRRMLVAWLDTAVNFDVSSGCCHHLSDTLVTGEKGHVGAVVFSRADVSSVTRASAVRARMDSVRSSSSSGGRIEPCILSSYP